MASVQRRERGAGLPDVALKAFTARYLMPTASLSTSSPPMPVPPPGWRRSGGRAAVCRALGVALLRTALLLTALLLTALLLTALPGCLHLGVPPVAHRWTVTVKAPVAEPDLDLALRTAVDDALRRRDALGGSEATLRVARADWRPTRRLGDALVYEALLQIEVVAGPERRTFSASTSRAGLSDGAAASTGRAEAFASLAAELGDAAAAWLVEAP